MVDEWSGFAALLANLIEKYAVVLNLDALPATGWTGAGLSTLCAKALTAV